MEAYKRTLDQQELALANVAQSRFVVLMTETGNRVIKRSKAAEYRKIYKEHSVRHGFRPLSDSEATSVVERLAAREFATWKRGKELEKQTLSTRDVLRWIDSK